MNAAEAKKAFAYQHLPAHLQDVSKPFHDMAMGVVERQPLETSLRRMALEKLLEAKDAVVRLVAQEGG